jgi:hypothetical protein
MPHQKSSKQCEPHPLSAATTILKMPTQSRVNRRKPRKYKGVLNKIRKSDRRELTAFERAFVCGADF